MSLVHNKAVHILTYEEILEVAIKVLIFSMNAAGIQLHEYQQSFGLRLLQSLLLEDGDQITALFSRQSGKTETVAVITIGACILLPLLAQLPGFKDDSRINKFKDGLWVGIFGPTYEIASIMYNRMAERIKSKKMLETLKDPTIDMQLQKGAKLLYLPNGSTIDCYSAAPGSAIEGRTLHLIIYEETQAISNIKIRKSISPMGAATGATQVKIGTPNMHRGDFYDSCESNRLNDLRADKNALQTHFQFDYKVVEKYNYRYKAYIKKEIERYGYDSDSFKMAYRLFWMLDRGTFVTPEVLRECGIDSKDTLKKRVKEKTVAFKRPDYPSTNDRVSTNLVAGLDIGRSNDSTVLTVAKVFWEAPVEVGGEDRYYIHIINWLELQGDNHEQQYPKILSFLANYDIGMLVIDATGRGDPVYDRLNYELDVQKDVRVEPFIFTQKSKHEGFSLLREELINKRISYPAGPGARKMLKWRKFVSQTENLEKKWKGKYMTVNAPETHKKDKGGGNVEHDDYPDSLMLLCWGVNKVDSRTVGCVDNFFTGNDAVDDTMRRERQSRNKASRGLGPGRRKRFS